ncbi:MAG: ACP S-malonyltransferase [Alphaproteobacteria bacterium]|nr:ACP S-malonyltransferase [Alphaproteobacteria bacterium]
MTKAFVFPGQGSQSVGMGKVMADNFAVARQVFEEVDDALNEKFSQIIFEGPEDTLMLTENGQPAIMATSMAVFRVLQQECGLNLKQSAKFVAGHSLGEYSALCAAESLNLSDTARLLRLRGKAMQKAVAVGEGAMAALLGLDIDTVTNIAQQATENEICAVANDNSPGQVVISGHNTAVARACELAKAAGAKRAVPLAVSAPFHCALMQPAADAMAEALSAIELKAPVVPVVSNISVEAVTNPETIRALLVQQVTGRVRWTETIQYMKNHGVEEVVELGNGKVLTGLVRRIDKELATKNISVPEDLDSFAKTA